MFDLEFIKIIKFYLDFFEDGISREFILYRNKNHLLSQTNKFEYIDEPFILVKPPFIEWIYERYLQEYVNDKKTKILQYDVYNHRVII